MTATRNLVIVGSGFAGVWAALAAARERRALGLDDEIAIRVVSPSRVLGIRPRFYEASLAGTTVELASLFAPVGIEHVHAAAIGLDTQRKTLQLEGNVSLPYDALVWAVGSALMRPALPGAERLYSVDTFADAQALDQHLRALERGATVVIVGAGFTGLEAATEMVARVQRFAGRVVLLQRSQHVAPDYGPAGRAVIERALDELGVERRTGVTLAEVTADAAILSNGESIATRTVVWTAGVQAHAGTRWLGPAADASGRIAVDDTLRVADGIWAAGDVARVIVDGTNVAAMSCQHASPQGRYAGHNALRWLAGRAPKRYEQHLYLTCLDLGSWGALITCGFERDRIIAVRDDAKPFKRFINETLIYPPRGDAEALLRAAAPPPGGRVASTLFRWAVSNRYLRAKIIARATSAQVSREACQAT